MMAAALTLMLDREYRDLHLFDTFEGMPAPSDVDRASLLGNKRASDILAESESGSMFWARASLDDVRKNLEMTGYPQERIRYVKGKVEDTLPDCAPQRISVLRLDTDWYTSTKWELQHLYPRLAVGGILIIDDYGYWAGARKATDEYLGQLRIPILLQRVDETGRIAVKISSV
jgi:O-methyltransferase